MGRGREGKQRDRGEGREGKENEHLPPTIFGLKVALLTGVETALHLWEHLEETCAIEANRDVTDKI